MKKFLNNRRATDAAPATSETSSGQSSPPPTSPGLKKSGTSRWKKSQKKQPEAKPQFNIEAALPPSDDFRTSLLMNNLSARFSMLREQDDPNSLLGKASDDSVLQPSRRSRMLDFGFGSGNLNDIAEVQSINSAIRPPFAVSRQDSFASEEGYGSDNETLQNGSVMSRSRPGEGNVLFGGRQKVYKIPTSGAASSKSLGKAVYEDDIGMSAFQKYKQREREAAEVETSAPTEDPGFDFGLDQADNEFEHTDAGFDHAEHGLDHTDSGLDNTDLSYQEDTRETPPAPNDSAKDLSHSPSLWSYDQKRSTVSSTARSEARSSTAATSVASQPTTSAPSPPVAVTQPPAQAPSMPSLKRSDTQKRRLYEQGLDQHIHEQQASALTRLNSIQRQRTLNHGKQAPPYLHSVKSANNIHDRTPQPVYALRAQSPTPSAPMAPLTLTTFGSIRKPNSNTASPLASGPQSPVSPQGDYFDEANVLTQMLEPGDKGKATAMGAFNKPKQSFDEDQYLERQRQLQRSQSNAGSKKDASAASAFAQRIDRFEQADRERSGSNASTRSRSRSVPKRSDSRKAYNVFQNAASQIAAQPGAQQYDTHRTFFGNISASDSEEEEDEEARYQPQYSQPDYGYSSPTGRWQPTLLPSVSEHPAYRSQILEASLEEDPAEYEEEEEENLEPQPLRPTPSSRSLHHDATQAEPIEPLEPVEAIEPIEGIEAMETIKSDAVDSPTLGPRSPEPLNGLVHHLRQKSNQSSIYPNDEGVNLDEVPEMPDMPWTSGNLDQVQRPGRNTLDSDSRIASTYANSNPWDLDDIDHTYYGADAVDRSSISPIEGARARGPFGSRAPSRATIQDRQSAVSPDSENANNNDWHHELRKQHTRDASTATQQERDAFANELAARRNAIQENMKSIVEQSQSRNVSPAPSTSGARKAFGMLRSKSSRESVDVTRQTSAPTKAMKMLGIGASASSTTLNSQFDRNNGYSADVARSRANSASRPRNDSAGSRPRDNSVTRPPPLPAFQPKGPPPGEWDPMRTRGDSEASRPDRQPVTEPSPAPSQTSTRSRSNSEARAGRSRSRTGPYRDDLERAMVEGMGSSAAGHPELSPLITQELTPRPSPEAVQSQFDAHPPARSRSNRRPPVMTSYFDTKNLQPIQTALPGRLAPHGTTPMTLSPNVYSPAASSTRSVSPMLQNPTPPLSGANTPLAPTFTPPPAPIPRSAPLRKKTVSKASISEPKLISATSNIDTVDLPEGASLKNGMDEVVPPVPPLNPKRRVTRKILFGRNRGQSTTAEDNNNNNILHNYGRSKTPDPWMMVSSSRPPAPVEQPSAKTDLHFDFARNGRSNTDVGPHGRFLPKQSLENHSSPAIQQYGGYTPNIGGSPERVERSPLPQNAMAMDGGMF